MSDSTSLADYQQQWLTLLQERKTLMLSTLNAKQLPEASLTPFVFYEGCFWVLVSQLSAHTENLQSRPNVGVLIHEDEAVTANPFTVRRFSAVGVASVAGEESRPPVLAKMKNELGDTVSLLTQLPDFYLFSIRPISGRFIAGFGQAFDVDFTDLSLYHVNPNQK